MRHALSVWKAWSHCDSAGESGRGSSVLLVCHEKDGVTVTDKAVDMEAAAKPKHSKSRHAGAWTVVVCVCFLVAVSTVVYMLDTGDSLAQCNYDCSIHHHPNPYPYLYIEGCSETFSVHGLVIAVWEVFKDVYLYTTASLSYLESYIALQIIKYQVPDMDANGVGGYGGYGSFNVDCDAVCMSKKVDRIWQCALKHLVATVAEASCELCACLSNRRITS